MSNGTKTAHPLGEENSSSESAARDQLTVETYDGKVLVEWDPTAAVTPIGQLLFSLSIKKLVLEFAFYSYPKVRIGHLLAGQHYDSVAGSTFDL